MARDRKSDWRKLRDKRKADGPPTSLNPDPKPGKKPASPNSTYSPKRVKKSPPKPGKKPGYGTDNMPSASEVVSSLLGSNKPKAGSGSKSQQVVEYNVKKLPATPAKSKTPPKPATKPKKSSGGGSKAKAGASTKNASAGKATNTKVNKSKSSWGASKKQKSLAKKWSGNDK